MKAFKILGFVIASLWSVQSYAQKEVIEDTIIVRGICDMCKTRIEEAAYGQGVKYASWDKATDQLAIAFRSDKTSREEIEQRVVDAGHSTADKKAKREDYDALPDCCKYETQHKH